jgi:endonuclease YncB( thermonuclease family)
MNNLLHLILIAMMLSACTAAPTDVQKQSVISEIPLSLTTQDPLPSPTTIATQKPTPSIIPSPTQRIYPTTASTPTVELTFSDLAACLPEGTDYHLGFVTEIIDGDTIIIRIENGDIFSVRYIGIDAPERDEPFFTEAYNANANLVLQKSVILVKDISETDPYDRLLRYVIVDDIFVNLELVRIGFASAITFPPDIICAEQLAAVEQEALASRYGLWEATQTPGPSDSQIMIISVDKKAEYVDIQNLGSTDVDLAGWSLVSERGHQECNLLGTLGAGETMRIWAGSAQGEGFSCGYSSPIWNNSEPDAAVLYNAQGVEVSRK